MRRQEPQPGRKPKGACDWTAYINYCYRVFFPQNPVDIWSGVHEQMGSYEGAAAGDRFFPELRHENRQPKGTHAGGRKPVTVQSTLPLVTKRAHTAYTRERENLR